MLICKTHGKDQINAEARVKKSNQDGEQVLVCVRVGYDRSEGTEIVRAFSCKNRVTDL